MLPTLSSDEIVALIEPRPFAVSNTQIYRFKDQQKAYKMDASEHEINMMLAAGNCSIRPLEKVVWWPSPSGPPTVEGFTMSLERPLDVTALDPAQRLPVVHAMISCISALHSKGVVHGDVKPANMLICSDGRLRLCDFAEARLLNKDRDTDTTWEGDVTPQYMSPHRCRACDWPESRVHPPDIEDDLYGLGLSIWELYTGKVPWGGKHWDDVVVAPLLKAGQTVDVGEVGDEAIREVIRGYLRYGGAMI